jgi:hypothetical protein
MFFLPKFHCELNPIEGVWAQAKVYCQVYTNFTIVRLRQIIDPALDSVSLENLQEKPGTMKGLIMSVIMQGRLYKMLQRSTNHTLKKNFMLIIPSP